MYDYTILQKPNLDIFYNYIAYIGCDGTQSHLVM